MLVADALVLPEEMFWTRQLGTQMLLHDSKPVSHIHCRLWGRSMYCDVMTIIYHNMMMILAYFVSFLWPGPIP